MSAHKIQMLGITKRRNTTCIYVVETLRPFLSGEEDWEMPHRAGLGDKTGDG
jgi:hypothetical protein